MAVLKEKPYVRNGEAQWWFNKEKSMKANELMIGDWVKTKECRCRVDKLFKEKMNITCTWTDFLYTDVEPIPLTEEILKANGLLVDKNVIEKDEKYGDDSIIYIAKTGIYIKDEVETHWNVSVRIHETHIGDGVVFNMKFHFVHELQHALRLCGLNELADNFKLKAMEE